MYRVRVQAQRLAPEPVTFLTVNAVVAETRDEAMALMLPNLQMMARLRTGQPLGALDLVEDAEQTELSPQAQTVVEAGLRRAVVGSPTEAAEQVRALADEFGVDEVMVNPVASARRGTDPATAPAPRQDAGTAGQRTVLGRQPDHGNRSRRPLLVSDVPVLVAPHVVDDLPQPRVVRIVWRTGLAVTPNRFGPTLISTFGLALRL